MKPKTHSRFLIKKQAIKKGDRKQAKGYCMLHNKYISEKKLELKNCDICNSFIKLKELEEDDE